MASVAGKITAYDLTAGVIVNMDEAIYMYSPEELPLLTGQGADGLAVLSQRPVDQISFSWEDEFNLAPRSTVGNAFTTGDTFFTVAAGDQLKFSTGDVIMVRKSGANEIMRVTGLSATTTDALIVTRAFVGTATNYATGAVVIGLGTALAEGSDPENARATDRNNRSNNTQIFGPTKIQMSGTQRVIPRYGVPDEWAHQVRLRIYENAQSREQAILYGRQTNSTTSKIRTTGGLAEFLSTNTDSTSTQLTELKIQTSMQTCFNQGGIPDRLITNPNSLVDLNAINDTGRVRQEVVDGRRGRQRVTVVTTEYGDLTVVRDRWCHPFDAFFIRRDAIIRRVMRPLAFQTLAKTGDADNAQIVGEEGYEVKGERHMLRMSTLTY